MKHPEIPATDRGCANCVHDNDGSPFCVACDNSGGAEGWAPAPYLAQLLAEIARLRAEKDRLVEALKPAWSRRDLLARAALAAAKEG